MKLRALAMYAVLLPAGLLTGARAMQSTKPRALQVHLDYTGSGKVDKAHKIAVALWDTPNFVKPDSQDQPVQVQTATAKDATVTFANVAKVPAYVSAAYDPTGTWDQASVPPEGTSLGMYSNGGPDPAPIDIKPGETARVTVSFDDSFKMPKQEKK